MKNKSREKQLAKWRKRRERAQALHAEGLSLSEIGAKIGCSKQRVQQILRYQAAGVTA